MSKALDQPDLTRPPIVLKRTDHKRLMDMAMDGLLSMPRDVGALLQEILRATVLEDAEVEQGTAVLGSSVTFRSNDSDSPQEARLVLHPDAQSGRQISVLTNLGAGLLGLSAGQTIRWPDRVGGTRELTVMQVQPPEPGRTSVSGQCTPVARPNPELRRPANVVSFRKAPRPTAPDDDLPPTAA